MPSFPSSHHPTTPKPNGSQYSSIILYIQKLFDKSFPFLSEFLWTVVLTSSSFYFVTKIMSYMREKELKQSAGAGSSMLHPNIARLLKKRGHSLNKHEQIIALDASLERSYSGRQRLSLQQDTNQDNSSEEAFNDLGGMREIKEAIIRALVYPMRHPELFGKKDSLRQFPRGVLLYGPPGCGKTSLAKIVAKSCGCAFIHVRKELMGAKYFGESEKMTAAIFSLARKLSPAIIFIDEIESVFPSRTMQSQTHRVHQLQMSIMLENWDGFRAENKIMILGATNLKQALDPAALRRFQYQFKVQLPNEEERVEILKILLRNDEVSPSFDYEAVAKLTKGFSGSDLKSILQEAILLPIQDAMTADASAIEPLTTEHVMQVWKKRHQRT